ncbi:effector-associated constant component EACC1 [Streptomyces mirabilis]|uniref:effector-associated constant component EACC1 n=1 Tax=Streptomyces mirabilis TaxID=68239 RepID=UPI003811668A
MESTRRVRIAVLSSEGETVLRSLLDWLHHEDELRGRVVLERAAPRSGEMGGLVDALVVALGSGGAGAVLARSLSTWLWQRRSDLKITITSDGRTIELDAQRVPDVQALIREVGGLLGDQEPGR